VDKSGWVKLPIIRLCIFVIYEVNIVNINTFMHFLSCYNKFSNPMSVQKEYQRNDNSNNSNHNGIKPLNLHLPIHHIKINRIAGRINHRKPARQIILHKKPLTISFPNLYEYFGMEQYLTNQYFEDQ
jgi:hypothetical protein